MSRGPYFDTAARWGARMGDAKSIDYMLGILHDPWQKMHMGITAENVAERYRISREAQDQLAAESQRRAAAAIEAGHFASQIVPVEIPGRKGAVTLFDTDEHVRAATTVEALAGMKPAFKKEGGTVTAAMPRASTTAQVPWCWWLATAPPRWAPSRWRAWWAMPMRAWSRPTWASAGAGHAPRAGAHGPESAGHGRDRGQRGLRRQACAVIQELGLDPAKVNPNGSGISLGHPVGATGAIITAKAIAELHRIGGRYALVTMCIGGGQGIAAIFERV